ncbi:MAG: response regulator transcription factor [Desulfobacula sp.]|nr:response regulator transcription factor [Desulfobacula sp.]
MKMIKIVIADDHSILQHGLCNSLELEKNIVVAGKAESGYEAIELAKKFRPDMVIMDVSMPGLNGIEATKQILKLYPVIKVMALSMHTERIYIAGMMQAGASGYILKSCSFNELLAGIHAIISGECYFCREVKHLVGGVNNDNVDDPPASVFSLLSKREREILQLIAEGAKSRRIAEKLKISVKTVDNHRTRLKMKLNIHSIAELTKFAIAEGLTSPAISPCLSKFVKKNT